jgi:hypothetical protein
MSPSCVTTTRAEKIIGLSLTELSQIEIVGSITGFDNQILWTFTSLCRFFASKRSV